MLSGPGGLASWLRTSQLPAPANTISLPLDIGTSHRHHPALAPPRRHPPRPALPLRRLHHPAGLLPRPPPHPPLPGRHHQPGQLLAVLHLPPPGRHPPLGLDHHHQPRRHHHRHQPRRRQNPPQPHPRRRINPPAGGSSWGHPTRGTAAGQAFCPGHSPCPAGRPGSLAPRVTRHRVYCGLRAGTYSRVAGTIPARRRAAHASSKLASGLSASSTSAVSSRPTRWMHSRRPRALPAQPTSSRHILAVSARRRDVPAVQHHSLGRTNLYRSGPDKKAGPAAEAPTPVGPVPAWMHALAYQDSTLIDHRLALDPSIQFAVPALAHRAADKDIRQERGHDDAEDRTSGHRRSPVPLSVAQARIGQLVACRYVSWFEVWD